MITFTDRLLHSRPFPGAVATVPQENVLLRPAPTLDEPSVNIHGECGDAEEIRSPEKGVNSPKMTQLGSGRDGVGAQVVQLRSPLS